MRSRTIILAATGALALLALGGGAAFYSVTGELRAVTDGECGSGSSSAATTLFRRLHAAL